MTIQQLLDCSAEKLKKMNDAELLKYFEPYLKITRPELAEKPEGSNKKRVTSSMPSGMKQAKFNMVQMMAKNLGVELDFDEDDD